MSLALEKVGPNRYRLSPSGEMRVEAVVYLSDKLYRHFQEEDALQQLRDAATLPGVVGPVVGMPDIHTGFGLPIGGVMAVDAAEGVVSAGAVGMDINCGVRLLATHLPVTEVKPEQLQRILQAIEERVPTGVGKKSRHRELDREVLVDVLRRGVPALAERGYARPEDLDRIEEGGALAGADPAAVSQTAMERGQQLATLGGGNHFIEIGEVEKILEPGLAKEFGLEEGTLYVLIHTGSRGLGHQICTDYTSILAQAAPRYGIKLPSRGLAAAPISSLEGRQYLAAMACAVNFAFSNRQLITYDVRQAVAEVFGKRVAEENLTLVYDVAHNIAKFEVHGGRKLLVHRKGATRALPAGEPQNPPRFRRTGHPAIIPGSMGTASYVVVGLPPAAATFYSVNHGAGRVLSRTAARKQISVTDLLASMRGIIFASHKARTLLDEAPQAYKDIDEVVETLAGIGLTKKVARLRPLAVLKGEGEEG